MRQLFVLHHHKHTGRLIHHRHTSYWALALLVLLSGLLAFGIDRTARADTLFVSATVPAPIPTDAPAFDPQFASLITTSPDLEITGTCPVITPAVIIGLYRGSELLGSSVCGVDGRFAATVTLNPGTQEIIARVVTITGQYGQSSSPATITYTPPIPPTPPTPPTKTNSGAQSGGDSGASANQSTNVGAGALSPRLLTIELDQPFVKYLPDVVTLIRVRFEGGTPPYTVTVDWGDGRSSQETLSRDGTYTFSHIYGEGDSRLVSITARDNGGLSLTRRYAAVNAAPASAHTNFTLAGLLDGISPNTLLLTLSLYGALFASVLLLWRYELIHYRKRVGLPTHYHWQRARKNHK